MIVYVFITKSCGPNVKSYAQISLFLYQIGMKWVSNGSIKIRISKRLPAKVISHIADLEKLFPDNPLLKDDHIEA